MSGILRDIDYHTGFSNTEEWKKGIINYETESRINPIKASLENLNKMKQMISNKQTVGEIEDYLDEIVTKQEDHRLFKFKLSKEVAAELQKVVKNNLKAHKQITGLIVSFLMLPVSCSLLNWCYPRFMDIFFPKLSNKKHPKEIKNLVNQANHQTEVKS